MSRPIVVIRPEPGNHVTATAIEARGRTAIRLPLFATRPLNWEAPDAANFDALIVTSANAMRHGGAALSQLRELPVYAVGEASAEAARRAGFTVSANGSAGSAELSAIAEAAGVRRALHLAGRERTLDRGGIVAEVIPVYASEAVPVPADKAARLSSSVVLVQSARAGARLAEIVDASGIDRGGIMLVAIGTRAAVAAGPGWERVEIAPEVLGEAMIEAAIALAD